MTKEDVTALCVRYKLELIAVVASEAERSVLVARVRDQSGRNLVLKRARSALGTGEIAALRAWSESVVSPQLIAVLEPDLYLAEWLPRQSMADLPLSATIDSRALGRMINRLQSVEPPQHLPLAHEQLRLTNTPGWHYVPPALQILGAEIDARLRTSSLPQPALVHGDLSPLNILLTPTGPKVIDPHGYRGLPGWDLAHLAVAAAGRSRGRLLPGLLSGYGEAPPLLAEIFAWMTLNFLQRNLAYPDSPFLTNIQALADQLAQSDTLDTFLAQQLA